MISNENIPSGVPGNLDLDGGSVGNPNLDGRIAGNPDLDGRIAGNPDLEAAIKTYEQVGKDYIAALMEKGLRFVSEGTGSDTRAQLRDELRERGAQFCNAGASVRYGWVSPACVHCTGNQGSETFSTSFKCHRDCYFCFNYNQADYQHFVDCGCPWEEGLAECKKRCETIAAIGLTGGEPLLNFDESIRFLTRARELYPQAHIRMYTSGDLLTAQMVKELKAAGLEEIRFSVKVDDSPKLQQRVFAAMALARESIPTVMIEMPIIPGTEETMRNILSTADALGIDGINLLEFCFPFHSWEEFEKRDLSIRNPPFDVMYDYGYSGGLPIAGSEELALQLMIWAIDQGLHLGMHYCSLDNKHRSEMRQRNERGRKIHPTIQFDEGDFFLKTLKVFGSDVAIATPLLNQAGCTDLMPDDEEHSLSFAPQYLSALRGSGVDVAESYFVLESENGATYLRDIALKRIGIQ